MPLPSSGTNRGPWSPPPLHPYRRRPCPQLRCRLCVLRAWSCSGYLSSSPSSLSSHSRAIRIIRPSVGISWLTSSLHLVQPHRQRHHLFPDYFIYSSKQTALTLLPRCSSTTMTVVEAFSAVSTDNGVSGCTLYLARLALATSVPVLILDAFSGNPAQALPQQP